MLDIATIYAQAMEEMEARFRFDAADNLLTNPTDLEKQVALFDALQELNSHPPETGYTLGSIFPDPNTGAVGDPRAQSILFMIAGRNVLQTLVTDWTANGYSLSVEEFNVEDRLDRYKSLVDSMSEQISDRLDKFKAATVKIVKTAYCGFNNPLTRFQARNPAAGGFRRGW